MLKFLLIEALLLDFQGFHSNKRTQIGKDINNDLCDFS